jgi:hypothetical protein
MANPNNYVGLVTLMSNEKFTLKSMFRSICCWLYALADMSWAPFVKDHDAWFVRFVDFFKNPCGYCTAARMMFVGAAVTALALKAWLLGSLLLLLPVSLVLIERVASCATPPEPEPVDPTKNEGI